MDIETSSAIKFFFPKPSLTLVYFEAIANALDADATEIIIEINVESFDVPKTLNVRIIDNGSGFNDENFNRFKTLLKPRDKYHKGVGRLVFLNYFDRVEIFSTWQNLQRDFIFKDRFDGVAPVKILNEIKNNKTVLTFTDFTKEKVKSYDDLKPDLLKLEIIDHFLPKLNLFERENKKFKLIIKLKTNESNIQKEFFPHEAVITKEDLPQMTLVTIMDHGLDSLSSINMSYHVKKVIKGKGTSLIAFSIDGRTIPVTLIPTTAIPSDYYCVFFI